MFLRASEPSATYSGKGVHKWLWQKNEQQQQILHHVFLRETALYSNKGVGYVLWHGWLQHTMQRKSYVKHTLARKSSATSSDKGVHEWIWQGSQQQGILHCMLLRETASYSGQVVRYILWHGWPQYTMQRKSSESPIHTLAWMAATYYAKEVIQESDHTLAWIATT